jgi:hypothetical protein
LEERIMMKMIRRTTHYDEVTGQVYRSKDKKYVIFDNDKGYRFRPNSHYIKGYQGLQLSKIITAKIDIANMYLLSEHLYKHTNMICVRQNNKKYRPANMEDMSLMVCMCERKTKDFVKRMTDLCLIAKNTIKIGDEIDVQYHINPLYFNTSQFLSHSLYMMFRSQLDSELPPWVIERFNA